jgi:COP9 signalosome complex subunit 6
MKFNDAPIFLQLSTTPDAISKDLPIAVYESVVELVNGKPETFFIRSNFKVETGEAERIAVDHVAHASNTESQASSSRMFLFCFCGCSLSDIIGFWVVWYV